MKCATAWFASLRNFTNSTDHRCWEPSPLDVSQTTSQILQERSGKVAETVRRRRQTEEEQNGVQMRREWQCEEMKVFPFEGGWPGLV